MKYCYCKVLFFLLQFEHGDYIRTAEDVKNIRDSGALLFQQLPLLAWDGKNLVQAASTTRYIARKYGLDGKTDEEKLR